MDESRLIALTRSGSEDAAAALFAECWPLAWQWAYVVLGDRLLADQAAQEGIVRAFAMLDRFDPQRPFRPWLKRIVVNKAVDELRRERRHRRERGRFEEMEAVARLEDEGEELGELMAAVRELPLNARTVIVLHYWLDYGVEEIAEELRIPVGTVVSRLSRARSALREALGVANAD